jgi:hypothetical protein
MFGRDDVIVANLATTASEDFAGETVIIHFERGTYFSLQGSACAIWSMLQAPTSIAAMTEVVCSTVRLDFEATLSAFMAQLAEADLITTSQEVGQMPVLTMDAAARLAEPPVIEVFSDLAELIALDPVHEVDVLTGWPQRPGDVTPTV